MNMATFRFIGRHFRVFCERMKPSPHMQGRGTPDVPRGDSGFPFSSMSAERKDGNDKGSFKEIGCFKYLTIKVIFSVLHRQQEDGYGKAVASFSEGILWIGHLV